MALSRFSTIASLITIIMFLATIQEKETKILKYAEGKKRKGLRP